MSWFSQLFSSAKAAPKPQIEFPLTADLGDGLCGLVFLHDVIIRDQPRRCWTYISQGLSEHGHPELVMTIPLEAGEDANDMSEEPLQFFTTVLGFARKGSIARVPPLSHNSVV